MPGLRQQEYAQQRLVATLFAIFSILALALAAVGLFSVFPMEWRRAPTNRIRMAWVQKLRRISHRPVVYGSKRGRWTGRRHSLEHCFDKLATKWVTESSATADPRWRNALAHLRSGGRLHGAGRRAATDPCKRSATINPPYAMTSVRRFVLTLGVGHGNPHNLAEANRWRAKSTLDT